MLRLKIGALKKNVRGYIGVDVLLQALVRRWNMIWGFHSEKYSSSTSFKTHQALKYYAVVYDTVSQEDYTTLGNHVSNKFHPPSRQLQGRHYELIYPGSADCTHIWLASAAVVHCIVLWQKLFLAGSPAVPVNFLTEMPEKHLKHLLPLIVYVGNNLLVLKILLL